MPCRTSDLLFDNRHTVISAQSPSSDSSETTRPLFESHRKVFQAYAKALSGPVMLSADEYFGKTPVAQLLDDPADLRVLCTSLEHGCGEIGESGDIDIPRVAELFQFCSAGTTTLRMEMRDTCHSKVSRGTDAEREIWAKLPDDFEVYPNKRAVLTFALQTLSSH